MPTRKKQKKLLFASPDQKAAIDMEYARMIICSAVKSNFLESTFTFNLFKVRVHAFTFIFNTTL